MTYEDRKADILNTLSDWLDEYKEAKIDTLIGVMVRASANDTPDLNALLEVTAASCIGHIRSEEG
jgi:hypothetical protein